MPPSPLRRVLLAVVLSTGAGLASVTPTPVAAAPVVVAPTQPAAPAPAAPSTTSSTVPIQTAPAPEEPFEFGDVIDWAKDHLVQIIIVVGVLLLVGTWKMVSRSPTQRNQW